MAIIGTAFVQVRPDTSTFENEAGSKVGGALKKVAVVAAAAFAASGAKQFLTESVNGYREHNKLLAVTEQVIKTTGGAAKVSADDVSALSDAIERKTGVDGDAIQSGANLLLTFTNVRNETGKGNQIFSQATGLLADMSVALGQSTKGSAIQLGKALNDPIKGVTALSKVGVSFTDQQKEQIKTLQESGNTLGAQKIILAELSKEFGGAAAASVTSAEKQAVAYHALQDAVGAQLLPILDELQGFVATRILPTLTDLATKQGPKVTAFFGIAAKKAEAFFAGLTSADPAKITGPLRQFAAAGDQVRAFLAAGVPVVKAFFTSFTAGDPKGTGTAMLSLSSSVQTLLPVVQQAAASVPSMSDGIKVASAVASFFAGHVGLLIKLLPLLVAGFVAVKVAQAAANVVALANLPIRVAEIASNSAHTAALRANTAALGGQTAAENVGIIARGRAAVASGAAAAASLAASAASGVWAGAQAVLNAVLTANPIGLVIAAIALLVAGFVVAYKNSETFRSVVDGALRAVAAAGHYMWDVVLRPAFTFLGAAFSATGAAASALAGTAGAAFTAIGSAGTALWANYLRPAVSSIGGGFTAVGEAAHAVYTNVLQPVFRFIANAWLTVVGAIVNGAAEAFGWVPGIGPKLRAAAERFNSFRDTVNRALAGTSDGKSITIRTPGMDKAVQDLARLRYQAQRIPPEVTIRAIVRATKAAPPGENAHGTEFWRGGMSWVGERGPELLDLPRGSKVYTAERSKAMATSLLAAPAPAAAGINGPLVVVENLTTVDPDAAARAMTTRLSDAVALHGLTTMGV